MTNASFYAILLLCVYMYMYKTGVSLTCHIQHFVLERIISVNWSMRCYFTTFPVHNIMLTGEEWLGIIKGRHRVAQRRRLCVKEP